MGEKTTWWEEKLPCCPRSRPLWREVRSESEVSDWLEEVDAKATREWTLVTPHRHKAICLWLSHAGEIAGSFAQWQQNFPHMWIEPNLSSLARESTFFEISLWQTDVSGFFFLSLSRFTQRNIVFPSSAEREHWDKCSDSCASVEIMSVEIICEKQAFINRFTWIFALHTHTHTHKRWVVASLGKWDNLKFLHGSQGTAPLTDYAFALLNNNRNHTKTTWSYIPPQPTLFRQSSPFAFASTSTSITTESGRVTWQSILAVSSSKIFGVPLFQTNKENNNNKKKDSRAPSWKRKPNPLHQAFVTFSYPSTPCGWSESHQL